MKSLKLFLPLSIFALFLVSCDVDQTQETKLPDVDMEVDVEEGQMPKFDVDWADVNVGTTTKIVSVPKIKVVMEEEEIEVPYLDVDMPGDKEELTLVAEAEVGGQSHEINIVEVIASGKRINVISELKATGEDLQDERMRVSDRLVLNAPDLDVKHYIIGKRPAGTFNSQYTYVDSKSAAMARIKNGKSIYKN